MHVSDNRRNKYIEFSLYLGCLLSNISQLPFFVRGGWTQRLAFPGWILLLLAVIFSGKIRVRRNILPIVFLSTLLLGWLLVDSTFLQISVFSSSMIYSYVISMFIYFLGAFAADAVDDSVIDKLSVVFVVSMIVVSASIYIQYFGAGYSLATRIYAYGSKNSVSQIIFTAIILLITRFHHPKISVKFIKACAIAFEIYVLLYLRSRATLVSLLLAIIAIVFSRTVNKKVRAGVVTVGIIGIFLLVSNNSFSNFLINNVIFAGRDASNLNELTSGRVSILRNFSSLLSDNWFTGIGPTYYECFPLSAILQFGIPGGLLLISISIQPLIYSWKRRKLSENWELLFLVSLGYCVNGLFEGLTPFGPGVKCYYMWLLFGVLSNKMIQSEGNAYL